MINTNWEHSLHSFTAMSRLKQKTYLNWSFMNKKILICLSALCLLISNSSNAQWVQVTGEAIILESKATARVNALENAVFQAMTFTGGEIASLPQLKTYLQEDRQQYRFSGNEIRHISVLEQKDAGGKNVCHSQNRYLPLGKKLPQGTI